MGNLCKTVSTRTQDQIITGIPFSAGRTPDITRFTEFLTHAPLRPKDGDMRATKSQVLAHYLRHGQENPFFSLTQLTIDFVDYLNNPPNIRNTPVQNLVKEIIARELILTFLTATCDISTRVDRATMLLERLNELDATSLPLVHAALDAVYVGLLPLERGSYGIEETTISAYQCLGEQGEVFKNPDKNIALRSTIYTCLGKIREIARGRIPVEEEKIALVTMIKSTIAALPTPGRGLRSTTKKLQSREALAKALVDLPEPFKTRVVNAARKDETLNSRQVSSFFLLMFAQSGHNMSLRG
jgi:hypothetical protein